MAMKMMKAQPMKSACLEASVAVVARRDIRLIPVLIEMTIMGTQGTIQGTTKTPTEGTEINGT
jgi:hypothetical protein